MYLSEIFDQLTYGELVHLEMGGAENSGVNSDYYPSLVANINLALTALHTRFYLKTKEVIVQQYEQIQTYTLHSRYAESNTESLEPIKYIKDSIYQPFIDDVLKIEQVFDEGGVEVKLNDENDYFSVFTPSFNTIQIPYNHPDNSIAVVYRANHEKLVITNDFHPSKIEVDIAWSYLEPLLFYVAHRYFVVNGLQGSGQDSVNFLNKYNASCNKLDQNGLINKSSATNNRLELAGWI